MASSCYKNGSSKEGKEKAIRGTLKETHLGEENGTELNAFKQLGSSRMISIQNFPLYRLWDWDSHATEWIHGKCGQGIRLSVLLWCKKKGLIKQLRSTRDKTGREIRKWLGGCRSHYFDPFSQTIPEHGQTSPFTSLTLSFPQLGKNTGRSKETYLEKQS